jgi:hypothetical protein
LSGRIYCRVDILNPVNQDEWDIVEVKSSGSVKNVNLHDVSFQKLCVDSAGVKIRKSYLAHINTRYVRDGEINPHELFGLDDVSDEMKSISDGIRNRVIKMLRTMDLASCPKAAIGSRCSYPYQCSLTECWDALPEHHVFTLSGGDKSDALYRSGVIDIAAIPAVYELNDKQRIQCDCVIAGTAHVDKEAIRRFLGGLEYPLYYLDFETFGTAVPLFNGTSGLIPICAAS